MLRAARCRLRLILMTALAAIKGMLPLAFALGAGSQMCQPPRYFGHQRTAFLQVLALLVTASCSSGSPKTKQTAKDIGSNRENIVC